MRTRSDGFALIELAAVVAIIGLVMTMFIIKLDGIVPSAKLRAASRSVGGSVELALSDAVMKGSVRAIVYDMEEDAVRVTSADGVVLSEQRLPSGIEIDNVEGIDAEKGKAVLSVFPSGIVAPHCVRLRGPYGVMTVEVYGLTGSVRYHEGDVKLREFTREHKNE